MRRLHNALNATGYPFEHYGWSKAPEGDYGVYAEDSGEDFVANDVHLERGTAGTVDLFTRDDTSAPHHFCRISETSPRGAVIILYIINTIKSILIEKKHGEYRKPDM